MILRARSHLPDPPNRWGTKHPTFSDAFPRPKARLDPQMLTTSDPIVLDSDVCALLRSWGAPSASIFAGWEVWAPGQGWLRPLPAAMPFVSPGRGDNVLVSFGLNVRDGNRIF